MNFMFPVPEASVPANEICDKKNQSKHYVWMENRKIPR